MSLDDFRSELEALQPGRYKRLTGAEVEKLFPSGTPSEAYECARDFTNTLDCDMDLVMGQDAWNFTKR